MNDHNLLLEAFNSCTYVDFAFLLLLLVLLVLLLFAPLVLVQCLIEYRRQVVRRRLVRLAHTKRPIVVHDGGKDAILVRGNDRHLVRGIAVVGDETSRVLVA